MDKQLNMFDGTKYDKVNQAIKLIQEFEEASIARNPLGYVVGYSGGKDSLFMLNLILHNLDKYPLDGVVHFELEIDEYCYIIAVSYTNDDGDIREVMSMRAKYRVAVSLSGRTNNFENKNEDGYFFFTYYGNVRTTEKSAIAAVKRICSLGGCKVESVKAIEKNEVCL